MVLNKQDFTKIVQQYNSLTSEDIQSLKLLTDEFSWFSTAQVLLAKAMHASNHIDFKKQLKIAAITGTDRNILYNLIHNLPLQTIFAEITPSDTNENITKPATVEHASEIKVVPIAENEKLQNQEIKIVAEEKSEIILSDSAETAVITQNLEHEILEDFDITSIDATAIPGQQPQEILSLQIEQDKSFVNNSSVNKQSTHEESYNLINTTENNATNTDPNKNSDFLNWLDATKKQTDEELIISEKQPDMPEEPTSEDTSFVNKVTLTIADTANKKLKLDIEKEKNIEAPDANNSEAFDTQTVVVNTVVETTIINKDSPAYQTNNVDEISVIIDEKYPVISDEEMPAEQDVDFPLPELTISAIVEISEDFDFKPFEKEIHQQHYNFEESFNAIFVKVEPEINYLKNSHQ